MAQFIQHLNQIEAVKNYLVRVNAEPRTLKTAVVKQDAGRYWYDKAIIRFSPDGTVTAPVGYEPTETEANAIRLQFTQVDLPRSIPVPPDVKWPKHGPAVFEFADLKGQTLMLQERVDRGGGKNYLPWSYWSDGRWRQCEPEGPLPLYGLDQLADNSTVFVHEGAKAARACQDLSPDHPWYDELSNAAHLGWIGGALNPNRTDFGVLRKQGIKRAYIVVDNDSAGKAATPAIAQRLHCPTFALDFTDLFPVAFDLADEFPAHFYKGTGGKRFYVGPRFGECLHPATWMTDPIANEKGKPTYKLRDAAKATWAYVEEADMIICREVPSIMHPEGVANKVLAPYSHVRNTAALIVKEPLGRIAKLTYRPDVQELIITSKESSAINLHAPTSIKPMAGDAQPWTDFLAYLVTDPAERIEVEKWCATLIARPGTRMGYGLLMVSERQGIGKTTLGEHVLAPLVGLGNVGFPGEQDILSSFNEWSAHKRLAIIGEIYAGTSWKSYNILKTVVTDKYLTINRKYVPQYIIENWCHIYACSNSLRALKIDDNDRRWYYPELTNQPWRKAQFASFRAWLEGGGLNIIHRWALDYGSYVEPGDHAPMTERKRELVEASLSEAQKEVRRIGTLLDDTRHPATVAVRDVRTHLRDALKERIYDSDLEIRKGLIVGDVRHLPKRIKMSGEATWVVANAAAQDRLDSQPDDLWRDEVRRMTLSPSALIADG